MFSAGEKLIISCLGKKKGSPEERIRCLPILNHLCSVLNVCVCHRFEPGQQRGWAGSLYKVSEPKGFTHPQLSKLAHSPHWCLLVHTFACVSCPPPPLFTMQLIKRAFWLWDLGLLHLSISFSLRLKVKFFFLCRQGKRKI